MNSLPQRTSPYRVGIMTVDVAGNDPAGFDRLTRAGIRHFEALLEEETSLTVDTFAFEGPHIDPEAGAYSPMDFIQIGIAERAERGFTFLLVLTNVDLSSSKLTYTLALPSPLTNIAVASTKRLRPTYWGHDEDPKLAGQRLGTLLMHAFGRLLNLDHDPHPTNIMSEVAGVESLDVKRDFTSEQREVMRENLPKEAFDASTGVRKGAFALRTLVSRAPAILRATFRANPIRLVGKLPTMLATALSVIIVLIFAAETWDYAGEVSPFSITVFALFSFATAVFVLYRAFGFEGIVSRDGKLLESTVITAAATVLTLFLATLFLFVFLGGLMWFVAEVAFPDILKETWSSTGKYIGGTGDLLKLSTFLASIGVLAGSLGGAADSKNIIRNVIFAHPEV